MESSRGIPLGKKRFLLRDSDRSGFTYKNIELVHDNGSLVGPDEFDMPPPSDRLYPGEGDVSPGDVRNDYLSYSVQSAQMISVQYVTSASTISLNRQTDNAGNYTFIKSIVYVCGSAGDILLDSNPQISPSEHGDFLAVQGVGSSVTIRSGSGLSLYTSYLKIDSGTIVNLIYNATNGVWHETSRMDPNFSFTGAF